MMATANITIELEGKSTFVEAFSYRDAIDAFLALLREIDGSITHRQGGRGYGLRWYVEGLHSSNPTIDLVAEPEQDTTDIAPLVIETAMSAVSALQREPKFPPSLTFTGLEHCESLASVMVKDSVSSIFVRTVDSEVRLTHMMGANIREILGQKAESLGSLEGDLQMITLRGRRYFNVYSILTGKATRCYFHEPLYEEVKSALGKRVIVRGVLNTYPRGEGQEMTDVKGIEVVEESHLPTPDDIMGLWPQLTNGVPAERYVKERWRGGRKA